MKWIEYDYYCNESKGIIYHKKVEYNDANLAIAQQEAIDGNYTITEDEEAVELQPLAIKFGGTGAKTADEARANFGAQKQHITKICTLSATGWSNNTQTVDVNGVTQNNTLVVAAAPESYEAYLKAGVYCSAQSEGKMTFTCSSVPTVQVRANVMIWN